MVVVVELDARLASYDFAAQPVLLERALGRVSILVTIAALTIIIFRFVVHPICFHFPLQHKQ